MKKLLVVCLGLLIFIVEGRAQSRVQSVIVSQQPADGRKVTPDILQTSQPIPFKSVTLAVTLSAILPGAGELYAGNFESGKYALIAEAALWVTYAALYTHGNWIKQDARLFATEHAGANFTSKADQFDVDVGNYLSVDDYNQAKLRNRQENLLYTDPSFSWKWDSDADRGSFKSSRIRSDEVFQNSKFVIAAAVVNRIFSAFSAGRATAAYNRKILIEGAWNLDAHPTSSLRFADGVCLDFTYTF